MRKSNYAYVFLLGLGLSACSEKRVDSPKQPLVPHAANGTQADDYDFPFSPNQYVSKDVQIVTPEDSTERKERMRDDVNLEGDVKKLPAEEPDGGYTKLNYAYLSSFANTFEATAARTATYTFVSSDGVGRTGYVAPPPPMFTKYASYPDYIYDIQIAKSSSAGVAPKPGYYKLPLDLNRGAGGKYIYLSFSRTEADYDEYQQDTYPGYMRFVNSQLTSPQIHLQMRPLNNITARTYRISPIGSSAPSGFNDVYQYVPQMSGSYPIKFWKVDLNDGSGGRYIRPFKSRTDGNYAPIREVGVVAGNSSNIWPPSGWLRDNTDLNEGAGGDYIYFCYKR